MPDILTAAQEWRKNWSNGEYSHIQSMEGVRAAIQTLGFCLFSQLPDLELPSMSAMIAESARGELWGWKDALPGDRQVYYGAIFHPNPDWSPRPGFLSLPMLAALYALAPISQLGGDRTLLPRWAHLSPDAVLVVNTLARDGALATRELRRITGMNGKENKLRFDKAMTAAQAHFLIGKIGVTSTTRGNYGYVWDTFERTYAETCRQAESLTDQAAADVIIRQYVETAGAVMVERIAAMLALDARLLCASANRLVQEGQISKVTAGTQEYLVSPSLLRSEHRFQ